MAIARNPSAVSSALSGGVASKPALSRCSNESSFCLYNHRSRGWSRGKLKLSRTMAADSSNNSATSSSPSSSSSSSSGDAIRLNGGAESLMSSWWQEAFAKVDTGSSLLQVLHEGARVFGISLERNASLMKSSWLVNKWTGFDIKAWTKLISYQVSVYALLQAAMEIATRGEGRDRDVHVSVQRSLSRQCGPLEDSINKLLSSRDPSSSEWLWSKQLPLLVSSFVNIIEKDPQFCAVTSTTSSPSKASDVSLLRLTISACGAAMKLGAATLVCTTFISTLTEEIGRQMNMLTEFEPISEVYSFACNLGLRREFLSHFGPRAASNDYGGLAAAERAFWVDLSEHLIRNTLVREGVLTKLRPYDTPEALERDLAVFGFFAALGRRARAYMTEKPDTQLEETLASLLRYLEGGCVLFYPQLSTLTYYQLFIEVVCEEMEWLPTFTKRSLIKDGKMESEKVENDASTYAVLNVCSRWVADFLKYSTWVQEPGGSRVVDFLIKCQSRLLECREKFNLGWDSSRECLLEDQFVPPSVVLTQKQLKLFDEDLQNMEEAISRLEILLESSGAGGSDKLVSVRKDLERLRRLKKEAEALEVFLKAKADGKELQACLDTSDIQSRLDENGKTYNDVFNKSIQKLREASADLWRGTQLLGMDVAAASILLKNGALGQKLTEREKKTLMRTFTDLASVIPIGFLMLLPVTAVGHAAMLAAIQKYVPALIPSAYAPERLDLLRQLEKVKQMEAQSENQSDE